MLKVELHSHTSDDPVDLIPYTTAELIDHAAALNYDALAITLHERQLDIRPFASYAADRGLVLIPGIERTIEGRHVLLLNFSDGTEEVHTFADLRRLKQRRFGLVVAPHPYFPSFHSLHDCLRRHADVFDAVEYNAMFTGSLNFNRAAEAWAQAHGKPMVGNGDVHRLQQLGPTYSMVNAERNATSICDAITVGGVEVVKSPLSWATAATVMASLVAPSIGPSPRAAHVAGSGQTG
jgi:predicted metal-dependent phosphoesterase TrpH